MRLIKEEAFKVANEKGGETRKGNILRQKSF